MKKLQFIGLTLLLTITTLFFTNCSDNEKIETNQNFEYKSEKLNINELINKKLKTDNKSLSNKAEPNTMYSILKINLAIPKGLNKEELDLFLTENINTLDGTFEVKINEETDVLFEFKSGHLINQTYNEFAMNNLYSRLKLNCSFGGVRSCAKDDIYSKSDFSKIICAFSFWSCYGESVGNCVVENCF